MKTDGAKAPPEVPDFGPWCGKCGPARFSWLDHYVLFGIVMLAMAVFAYVWGPEIMKGGAGTPEGNRMVCSVTSGLFAVFGLGMLWNPLFGSSQVLFLFEGGLVERLDGKDRAIPFEALEEMELQEFYEHRFAYQIFLVQVRVAGQEDLCFRTDLPGDASRIVDALRARCPVIRELPFVA